MAAQDEIIRKIRDEATRQGLPDPDLAVAVAMKESSLNPAAVGDRGLSLGLFQLQEKAAIDAGIDPARRQDLDLNIRGGVTYLKQKLDQSGGNVEQALRRYNSGTPDFRGVGDSSYVYRAMAIRRDLDNPAAFSKYGAVESTPLTSVAGRAVRAVGRALSPASAEAAPPTGALGDPLQITVTQRPLVTPTPVPPEAFTRQGAEPAPRSPDLELQEWIKARDPRTQFIDTGLKILGRTRASFGPQIDDPIFQQQLYESILKHAERLEPKLNQSSPLADYHNVLLKDLQEQQPSVPSVAPRPAAPAEPAEEDPGILAGFGNLFAVPARFVAESTRNVGRMVAGATQRAGEVAPPEAGGVEPAVTMQGLRTAGRVVVGGRFLDPIAGALDLPAFLEDSMDRLVTGVTGLPTTPSPRYGTKLKDYIDTLLGTEPSDEMGQVEKSLRSMAAFMAPFRQIMKSGVFPKVTSLQERFLSRAGERFAQGAGAGYLVDTLLTDPDTPFTSDMLLDLYLGVGGRDHAVVQGHVERFLDGTVGEDVLRREFAKRGIRGLEGLVAGVPIPAIQTGVDAGSLMGEGLFRVLRNMQTARMVKRAAGIPPGQPATAVPDPVAAAERTAQQNMLQGIAVERRRAEAFARGREELLAERMAERDVRVLVTEERAAAAGEQIEFIEERGALNPTDYAEGLRLIDELRHNPGATALEDARVWLSRTEDVVSADADILRERLVTLTTTPETMPLVDDLAEDLAMVARARVLRESNIPAAANEGSRIRQDMNDIRRGVASPRAIATRYGAETSERLFNGIGPDQPLPSPIPPVERGVNPLTGEQLRTGGDIEVSTFPRLPPTGAPEPERAVAEALAGVQEPTGIEPSAPFRELPLDQMEAGQAIITRLEDAPTDGAAHSQAARWLRQNTEANSALANGLRDRISELRTREGRTRAAEDIPLAAESEAAFQEVQAQIRRRNQGIAVLTDREPAMTRAAAVVTDLTPGATLDDIERQIAAQRPPAEPPAAEPPAAGTVMDEAESLDAAARILDDADKPAIESGIPEKLQQHLQDLKDLFGDENIQRAVIAAMIRGGIGAAVGGELIEPLGAEAADDTPLERQTKKAAAYLVGGLIGVATLGMATRYVRRARAGRAALSDATGAAPAVHPRGEAIPEVAAAAATVRDLEARPLTPWLAPEEINATARRLNTISPTEIRAATLMSPNELSRRRIGAQEALDRMVQSGKTLQEISQRGLQDRVGLYLNLEQRAGASAGPLTPPPEAAAAAGARPARVPGKPFTPRASPRPPVITFANTPGELYERVRANTDFLEDPGDFVRMMEAIDNAVPENEGARIDLLNRTTEQSVAYARTLATSETTLNNMVRDSGKPYNISARITVLAVAAEDSLSKLLRLHDTINSRGGIENVEKAVVDQYVTLMNRTGEIMRGVTLATSDFGRGMNVIRQMRNGRMGKILSEGPLAGEMVASREGVGDIMKAVDAARAAGDGSGVNRFVKKYTDPTAVKALEGVLIESILGSFSTPSKAAISSVAGAGSLPLYHLGGALLANLPYKAADGTWVVTRAQRDSIKAGLVVTSPTQLDPTVMEAVISLQTLATTLFRVSAAGIESPASRAFWETMKTGETPHVVQGSLVARKPGPSLTARAFGTGPEGLAVPTGVDRAVAHTLGIQTRPFAGNIVDAVGLASNIANTRPLSGISEVSQLISGEMEKTRFAYRMALHEAGNGRFTKGSEEFARFIDDFVKDPPADVMEAVRRSQTELDFMQNLWDPKGGFANVRKAFGYLQLALDTVPFVRVADPFLRSVANMLVSTLQHVPGTALIPYTSFAREFFGPDPVLRAAAHGKQAVGTAALITTTALGAMGFGRGRLTNDPDLNEELRKAGRPPNSFGIGDFSLTLLPTMPVGFIMTGGFTLGQMLRTHFGQTQSTPEEIGAAGALVSAWYDLMKTSLYIKAFGELWSKSTRQWQQEIDAANRRGEGVSGKVIETIDDLFLSHLPSRYAKEVEAMISPHKQVFDGFIERIASNTPGWSSTLKTETDVFMRKRLPGGGLSDATLNNAVRVVSGMDFENLPPDPLDKALGDKGVVIRDPQPTFTVPRSGISVPLDHAERQRLREIISHPSRANQSLYKRLLDLTAHPGWKAASPGPEGQADAEVQKIYRDYSTEARNQLWSEDTAESRSIREKALEAARRQGIVPEEQFQQFQQQQRTLPPPQRPLLRYR